jgi:hypothetical protein
VTGRRRGPVSEVMFQADVLELAAWLGLLVYHTHDSRRSAAGFPDLVIVGSRVLFRELKTATGRIRPDQERWLLRLREAGQDADVWRPADWPDRIHTELRRLAIRSGRPGDGDSGG